jgi:hypothetical protein
MHETNIPRADAADFLSRRVCPADLPTSLTNLSCGEGQKGNISVEILEPEASED